MADLIEIGIEVRSGSVKSATREVDQLGNSVKSAQRSASAFVAAFQQQERQLNKVVEANKKYAATAQEAAKASQAFFKSMQQANLANKSAADSADVFAKRLEQLKQKYNPLYATSRQYENMLNEINEAHRLGALNTDQFKAAQERLNREFTNGTGAFAKYQQQFSQGFNQMGVISQQVGYQVGDFLVQVQSGTNPMVAFGQQATQLLGVLYLLPAPVLASSVAIGALSVSITTLIASVSIILPLLTAIGSAFLRSGDEAKSAKRGLDEYASAIENIENKIKRLRDENLSFDNPYFDPEFAAAASKRVELANRIAKAEAESVGLSGRNLRTKQILIERLQEELDLETEKFSSLMRQLQKEEEKNRIKKEAAEWEEGAAERAETLNARRFNLWWQRQQEKMRAEEELLALTLRVANVPVYEPLSQAEIAANKAKQELINGFESAMKLKQELGEGAYEALRLAGVDMASPISDAKKEAAKLAADLGVSLEIALAMSRVRENETVLDPRDPRYDADKARLQRLRDMMESGELYNSTLEKVTKTTKKNTAATKDNRTAYEKAIMTAQEFADTLDQQVISAVDGVADAFSEFLQNGMSDFKSFVGSIKDMFVKLLADMAAMALKRQILIPIATGMAAGVGSTAAAQTMASGTGSFAAGTMGATLAAGASSLGTGFMAGMTGAAYGGVSGYAATLSATAANAGVMATIGAAIPAVLAVVAVIGLFTKKTKLLDSGLRTTVEGFDVAIDTFKKTQSSRLFGLLKGSKKTGYEAANAELADPLTKAIGDMQQSIVDAAGTLGIGAEAFDNFSYQFKLSLKGLTEEEQLQKINEEILKMGDAFASLTGHFSTMNELLAVAQQRYDLTTRLLQLQGNEEELIARYREQERAATHELNQDLLDQIYALEDQQIAVQKLTNAYNEASDVANQAERDLSAANGALAEAERNVQQAASELQRLLDESLDAALSGLERAIDARRDSINQKYDTLISGLEDRLDAANEAASRSAEVYSILSGALSGRSISGITFASRQAARAYVAGGGSDVERLQAAVGVLSEPSRQLFGSFEDYARDFAITSNVLKESKDAAEAQMTADEKAVSLLQEQIDQADRDREDQLRVLDEQLEAAKLQIDALKGIDTTILSVDEAMQNVRDAMATYEQTQANHVELNSSVLSIGDAISALASAVQAQAAAQAAAAAAQQAQAAAAAKAAEAQEKLALAQSGAATDVNSTAAKMSLDTAAKISSATPMSSAEKAMLSRFSGGQRPDHIQLAVAQGYQYDPSVGGYRKFASGGLHMGGARLVGEHGPELEVTGPSRIYSASQTKEMMSNPELVAEIKELRREIADTKAEQRAANVAMVKYNKRTSDQLRTWNSVGLPQERTV